MNNVGVIDTFLNTYVDCGFGLIKGEVTYLASTLIVIDITLTGAFWAWGADEDIFQRQAVFRDLKSYADILTRKARRRRPSLPN